MSLNLVVNKEVRDRKFLVWNHGIVVAQGTVGDCIAEIGEVYNTVGRPCTLANVMRDGFIIEEVR